MSYRRDRSIRDVYEQCIDRTQQASYQRVVNLVDRRPAFSRTEDDYNRGGCGYHGDDQRGYHGERTLYSGERRSGPLHRRGDPYSYYRDSAEDPSAVRQAELRNRVTSQTSIRNQREDREALKRKASFTPIGQHSPVKREVSLSPHTRSSRSFSPDSGKASHPYPSQPKRSPFPQVTQEKERTHSYCHGESQGGSPHISISAAKDEMPELEVGQSEETKMKEDPEQSPEARRAHAIANKALEIEKLYRQDCETFGMVVKMLLAKQPALEKQLQTALKENLIDIKHRCLEDLRHFISEISDIVFGIMELESE